MEENNDVSRERLCTSMCGLWCEDCIPSNERLFELTKELQELLEKTGFEYYAKYKENKVPEFKQYTVFLEVLKSFEKVHCYHKCINGPVSVAGCAVNCKMRQCVLEKKLDGCWQCPDYMVCEYITGMEGFHPDIRHNLNMIKEYGMDHWSEKRGKPYYFSKDRKEEK